MQPGPAETRPFPHPPRGRPDHEPFFSILIPAYNADATIAETLDSVLSQTMSDYEILVCNDGSTDDTARMLEAYSSHIRKFQQRNRGLSAARNRLLHNARGEFVVLLDADDIWYPDRLRRLAHYLRLHPSVSILTTDAVVEAENGAERYLYYSDFASVERLLSRPMISILRTNFVFSSAAVRRKPLLDLGGFREDLPQDGEYEAWIRLILQGERVAILEEPLAKYRRSPESYSKNRLSTYAAVLQVLREYISSSQLTTDQMAAAREHYLETERRRRLLRAYRGLKDRRVGARKSCLVLIMDSDVALKTRAKFALAAILPRSLTQTFLD